MSMFSTCRLDFCIIRNNNSSRPVAFRVCPNSVKSNESHRVTQNHDIPLSLGIGRIKILQKERSSGQYSLFAFARHERSSKSKLQRSIKRSSWNVLKNTGRYLIVPLYLRLRNTEFRQASKARLPRSTLPYPGQNILTQTTKRFTAYQTPHTAWLFVARVICVIGVDFKRFLDIFQVITFWQLAWIVFCNASGAGKRL